MPDNDYLITGAEGLPQTDEMGLITEGIGFNLRPVINDPSATQPIIFTILSDNGDWSISESVNNQDFRNFGLETAWLYVAEGTRYVFDRENAGRGVWEYVGPSDVNIGVFGTEPEKGYLTTDDDYIVYVPTGATTNHSELSELGLPNAHPQSAITNLLTDQAAQDARMDGHDGDVTRLDAEQDAQDAKINKNISDIAFHGTELTRLEGEIQSNDTDISNINAHQATQDGNISTNASDIATNAANLAAHEAAADPHGQYALETAVLANFVAAGYGGIGDDSAAAMPDITSTWVDYNTWDTTLVEPFLVTHDIPTGLRFDREGIWQLNLKISLAHNESQSGRLMQARFYNHTLATPSATEFNYAIGRNQLATNIYININTTISAETVGHVFGLQLASGTDTFTSVAVLGSYWTVNHVSEFKGQL